MFKKLNEKGVLHEGKSKIESICFAIVTYKEKFNDTKAFVSIKNSLELNNISYDIYIYDNTDSLNWHVDYNQMYFGNSIYYYHDGVNVGISKAYNRLATFAKENDKQWIVFMDQDTIFPVNAVAIYKNAAAKNSEVGLKAPILKVNGVIFSPFRTILTRSCQIPNLKAQIYSLDKIKVINSGLMVSLDVFWNSKGYNEAVKIDFADFLFLDRAKAYVKEIEILDFIAIHDFSHSETQFEKVLSRYIIYINDWGNCPKESIRSNARYILIAFLHTAKLSYKFKSLVFFKEWIKVNKS